MKVCVTSQGDTVDADVDPRFGRCQYFMIYDSDSGQWEAVANAHKDGGGAGIQVSQVMADKKVNVVLTGNVGPNGFQALKAGEIEVVTGVTGTIKQAYAAYMMGDVDKAAEGPTVESHYGLKK